MVDGVGDLVDDIDAVDRINTVKTVTKVNPVIMALSHKFLSQGPAEGLVQQRLLQSLQRRELLLIEAGEALGLFA